MTGFFFWLTIVLFILICLVLILLVLIQKGRGGGLASAFGGAGGNTAFGTKTGDVLTWATSVIFGVFLLLAIFLNLLSDARQRQLNRAAATNLMLQQPSELPTDVPPLPQQPVETPDLAEEPVDVELQTQEPALLPGPAPAPAPTTQP